jgi:hypothetical protein
MDQSKRDFIKKGLYLTGGLALSGGVAVRYRSEISDILEELANLTPIGHMVRNRKLVEMWADKFPAYDLNIPLQSSCSGRIKKVYVGSMGYLSDEVLSLAKTLADYFPEVVLTSPVANSAGMKKLGYLSNNWIRDYGMYGANGDLILLPLSGSFKSVSAEKEFKKFLEAMEKRNERVRRISFPFEGGAILSADKKILMSREYQQMFSEEPFFKKANIVYISDMMRNDGQVEKSDFLAATHVDSYLTPVGKNRLLVADNKAGLEILSHLKESELTEYRENVKQLFLGTSSFGIDGYYKYLKFMHEFDDLRKNYRKTPADETSLLDRIAGKLSTELDIKRIPSVLAGSIILPYNNSLIEFTHERKIAIVPAFKIVALDDEAKKIYEKEGYHAVPVSMPKSSVCASAVHCTTLERREPEYS